MGFGGFRKRSIDRDRRRVRYEGEGASKGPQTLRQVARAVKKPDGCLRYMDAHASRLKRPSCKSSLREHRVAKLATGGQARALHKRSCGEKRPRVGGNAMPRTRLSERAIGEHAKHSTGRLDRLCAPDIATKSAGRRSEREGWGAAAPRWG
ncbi:hypothetical protein BC834DRAFT_873956 [Gloeopeniophorella convolvens]|nr:hypothetical protein BC834DRAFT_873956 [Gloeopeniophorella convolvens]